MKLTRDQLRYPWTDGLIIGFINKRQAEEMLLKCAAGTFLLRFSDSELGKLLYYFVYFWRNCVSQGNAFISFFPKKKQNSLLLIGGITIAWVEHNADNIPQILMLQPFCHKDFAIRSLGDRIKDLSQCITLYPDIPKDQAFGSYYTQIRKYLHCDHFFTVLWFSMVWSKLTFVSFVFVSTQAANKSTNGYVTHELRNVAEVTQPQLSSYPNTPQHSWQSSDDHTRDTPSVAR